MSAYLFTQGSGQYWIGLPHSLPPGGLPVEFADEGVAVEFMRPLRHDPQLHTLNTLLRLPVANDPVPVIAAQLAQGNLRAARAVVSAAPRGEAPPPVVKKAAPAALGFVRREDDPRPTPIDVLPPYRHKLVIEIAGQSLHGVAGRVEVQPRQGEARRVGLQQSGHDEYRVEVTADSLLDAPCDVSLALRSEESSGGIRLPLLSAAAPVEKSVQQTQWPHVLVPLMLLARSSHPALLPGKPRIKTTGVVPRGWLYVTLNGALWREVEVIDAQGTSRDVDLGLHARKDTRPAKGESQRLILVPHRLDSQQQSVEIAYSPTQLTWAQAQTPTARDNGSAENAGSGSPPPQMQAVDLSGYSEHFQTTRGNVGPLAQAPRIQLKDSKTDCLQAWREELIPVVYLDVPPVKKRVFRKIYLAGIFGSRLWNPQGGDLGPYVWDPAEDQGPLISHYAKTKWSVLGMNLNWTDDEITTKTTRLHNSGATVLGTHTDKQKKKILQTIRKGSTFRKMLPDFDPWNPELSEQDQQEADDVATAIYQRRQKRGWYEVLSSDSGMLEAFDEWDDAQVIYRSYAMGYDWRGDLTKAAQELEKFIATVQAVQDYPELGDKGVDYEIHDQVILVTHSMGNFVGRYASEVLKQRDKILGIVHINPPTTGAPVLYRRFFTGSAPEKRFPLSFASTGAGMFDVGMVLPGNVFAEILGNNAYHFTRMTAPLTGALQLLPTNDYSQKGSPHDWLSSGPAAVNPTPAISDIYDLYQSERFGLISHKRYTQDGEPKPYRPEEFLWARYENRYGDPVDVELDRLPPALLKTVNPEIYLPEHTPWHADNMRLRPHAGMSKEERKAAQDSWDDFFAKIEAARAFHERQKGLGLKYHPNTWIVYSTGLSTVVNARFELKPEKGEKYLYLQCPYETNPSGDGTVPDSSQRALLQHGAKLVGPAVTKGNVVHADICKNATAVKQVIDALTALTHALRPAATQQATSS